VAAFEIDMDVYQLLGFDAHGAGGGLIPPPSQILRQHVARPDPVILDVGASIGQSIKRYRAMFERPSIHAFEPDGETFGELRRQFGAFDSVRLNCTALSDSVGTAILHRCNFREASSLAPLDGDSPWARALDIREVAQEAVNTDTIDHYCSENGITTVDLLKIDVQGFEKACLCGAAGLLAGKHIRAIQLEVILHPLYTRPLGFGDIESVLKPHGYRLFTVFDLAMATTGELMQLDGLYVPA
jgi:FkbM family methyltransferase